MNDPKTLARPYAIAAYRFAEERQMIEEWRVMLSKLRDLVLTEVVQSLMNRPTLSVENWLKILAPVTASILDHYAYNFLHIILSHHRLIIIPLVAELFEAIHAEAKNIVAVDFTTAISLQKSDREVLVKMVAQHLGQPIQPSFSVDTSIIAGVVMRVGDKYVLDGSVKSKLARLKQNFSLR